MFQLVYISTARQPIDVAMLDGLLAVSRPNNLAAGVTGLLVAGGRRFLQALEGPEQPVLDTYARIKADPRHHALVLLTGRAVNERAFGNWSMASQSAPAPDEAGSLTELVDGLTAALPDKSLRAHFMGFAELHARAA